MAPHWAFWLLAVGLWGLGIEAEVWWNLVPRKTVSSGGECLEGGTRGARRDCRGKGVLRNCSLECVRFILQLDSRPTDVCDTAF